MSSELSSDAVICSEYANIPQTADEIVSDPALSTSFLARVNKHLPPNRHYDVAGLNKRLLNLRRRGEEKGGLVRKQRQYKGRNKPR